MFEAAGFKLFRQFLSGGLRRAGIEASTKHDAGNAVCIDVHNGDPLILRLRGSGLAVALGEHEGDALGIDALARQSALFSGSGLWFNKYWCGHPNGFRLGCDETAPHGV